MLFICSQAILRIVARNDEYWTMKKYKNKTKNSYDDARAHSPIERCRNKIGFCATQESPGVCRKLKKKKPLCYDNWKDEGENTPVR